MNKRKLLEKALAGSRNISFRHGSNELDTFLLVPRKQCQAKLALFEPCLKEMISLVEAFGFHLSRSKGSHFIFVHPQIPELVNLQEQDGKAKPYQIRQFLQLIERYHLDLED